MCKQGRERSGGGKKSYSYKKGQGGQERRNNGKEEKDGK